MMQRFSALGTVGALMFILSVLLLMGGGAAAQGFPATNTPRGTPHEEPSATTTATFLPTFTPSATFSPTATFIPTETATATETPSEAENPAEIGLLPPNPTLFYPPNVTPEAQITAVPTAMPRLQPRDPDGNSYNVVNIVLIGHDQESLQVDNAFRTDTMIIVHINLTTRSVAMLSLPRDLLVWIPGWQMQRLNLAWGWGEAVGWTDGGWGLFRQTILYNFGIDLHYHAVIDFSGFKTVIDTLGGVTVPVDCPIQDYLLVGFDDEGQPLFELTTIPIGLHEMDGTKALMYARSRRTSSDFDRGRRQQQILRAVWREGRDLGLITEFPSLWNDVTQIVETDLPLSVVIELAPLALTLRPNEIQNFFFQLGSHSQPWTTPANDNVQIPNPAIITLVQNFLTPPTQNRIIRDAASIDIYDASGLDRAWDWVAADRFAWSGLAGVAQGAWSEVLPHTQLIDYTGGTGKGSSLDALITALNLRADEVISEPDPNRTADFRVLIGSDYNACVDRQVRAVDENAPPITATPSFNQP